MPRAHASGRCYLSTKRRVEIYEDIKIEKVQVLATGWDRVHSLPKLKTPESIGTRSEGCPCQFYISSEHFYLFPVDGGNKEM